MTQFGSAQLTNAKFYGSAGMASLQAMLEHANRYGLKYIFVHDPYYEPLLSFVGWRTFDTLDSGDITACSNCDVLPALKLQSDAFPAPCQGFLLVILSIVVSFLALILHLLLPTSVCRRPPRWQWARRWAPGLARGLPAVPRRVGVLRGGSPAGTPRPTVG